MGLYAMGTFLSGSDEEEARKEALELLRRASALQPDVYTEPQGPWASYTVESMERQENWRSVMHLVAGAVLVVCLLGCIKVMERAEASMTNGHSAANGVKMKEGQEEKKEEK